jgi:6-phosphogluconolactonase
MINRARDILWLTTGDEKAGMLMRLRNGDNLVRAGRIRQDHAL